MYAYDAAGNQCLYQHPWILIENTPPVISNISYKYTSCGYDITCTVTDNDVIDHVQFPTWTIANGQDDLNSSYWPTDTNLRGTLNGNTATFKVDVSKHNNENGAYVTDIYAYDACGNVSMARFIVNYCVHSKSDWITDTAATCSKAGSKHKECTICGETTETEAIAKLPHTPSNWITDTAATCAKAGSKHKKCTFCNETLETAEITKLPHTYTASGTTAPTCTAQGYTAYTCTCGDGYNADFVPALGHRDTDGDGKCDTCGTYMGEPGTPVTPDCSCMCHKTGFVGFIYKLIRILWKIFGTNKVCECGITHY